MPEIGAEQHSAFLSHYGIQRKSGRYPWGSGGEWGSAGDDTPSKRSRSFFDMVAELEAAGLTKSEVAQGLGFESTTELRQAVTIAKNAIRTADQDKAVKLREKGWSHDAIGKAFDPPKNESSVRQLLSKSVQDRTKVLNETSDMLRRELDKGGFLDIGAGTEFYAGASGVSKEKLAAAVAVLKDDGYVVYNKVQVPQAGTTNKTTHKVLCPPGTEYKDVMQNLDQIRGLTEISDNGGRSYFGILPPMVLSSSRVGINYAEDGGDKADGVMYVRPGVKDVELGGKAYAQVRINVDGTHYLKGMAMYKNDLPPGVDVMFNTNKKKADIGTDKLAAMKKQQVDMDGNIDKDNPFGAVLKRQIGDLDADGRVTKVTSVMNLLQEEGNWDDWSRNLSSQVLSKQSPKLAKEQLDKTYARKREQLDEILALTNPTVRAKLLQSFADEADSSAVHLSAAGMPRSSYHVILPFNSLKDNEVYAPNFENGERVALIRYPHGGKFEIPELTVNNNAPAPKAAIGRAQDAVGINATVAARMSGADFDGDFVMVIPNNKGSIKTEPALRGLSNFDPQKYKLPDDVPRMSAKTKGKQMGDVSNLITDMTIKGASNDEIARAVRHSMVVIDAEKHHLDYKKSAVDNGISALKAKYQEGAGSGAATLISRATSQTQVDARRARRVAGKGDDVGGPIDRATGKLMYTPTGEVRTTTQVMKRTGEVRTNVTPVKQRSVKLAETDDARTLLSGPNNTGTVMERVYADHSNRLKALANESRRVMVNSPDGVPLNSSAKKVYKSEVETLDAKLKIALMNSPRERQAQVLANKIISMKREARPDMDDATLKKVKSQALAEARTRAGAKKTLVEITDREWDAIQAGAISKDKLRKILNNTDVEKVKTLATPKPQLKMNSANLARAKAMAAAGLTQAEIANALGIGLTTLKKGLADEG